MKQLGRFKLVKKNSHPQLWSSFQRQGQWIHSVIMTDQCAWFCFGSFPMYFLNIVSSSWAGTEDFFDPAADASCMNTYTRRDHVFAKLNLQLQRGTVTLSHQEPGTPQTQESAFMQLEFSGTAPEPPAGVHLSGCLCPRESHYLSSYILESHLDHCPQGEAHS